MLISPSARVSSIFAEKKSFSYSKHTKMNTDFWEDTGTVEWSLKPGVTRKDAYEDLHVHPKDYELGCKQATITTMLAGSDFDQIVQDDNVRDGDWIPGDWGYIKNPDPNPSAGEEGQNMIYLGRGKFWGIASGATIRTLKEWYEHVESWDGKADLKNWRRRPSYELKKTKP